MEIYIVEDDVTVISILEDIIEDNELGTVCGTTEGGPANVDEILALEPDVILVDFLMPGKDGVELVRELKEKGCGARCIMISQVSAKELVGKAYDAGMEFFISKPINIIEVKSVIQKVEKQIENEKTLSNIKKCSWLRLRTCPKKRNPTTVTAGRYSIFSTGSGCPGKRAVMILCVSASICTAISGRFPR